MDEYFNEKFDPAVATPPRARTPLTVTSLERSAEAKTLKRKASASPILGPSITEDSPMHGERINMAEIHLREHAENTLAEPDKAGGSIDVNVTDGDVQTSKRQRKAPRRFGAD